MTNASESTRKGWETRRARQIAAGWVPRAQRPAATETPEERTRRLEAFAAKRRAEVSAARLASKTHAIADCRMRLKGGEWWTLCSCGMRFEEDTIEATAEGYNAHSYEARVARSRGRVEIVEALA